MGPLFIIIIIIIIIFYQTNVKTKNILGNFGYKLNYKILNV